MIETDIETFNNMNRNIEDGLNELIELKKYFLQNLYQKRINIVKQIFNWHEQIKTAEKLKENELTYGGAYFILILIFGENIPSAIKDLIALFSMTEDEII